MLRVLYPGSFDVMTRGHMNIVEQASHLFDEVVIAILRNNAKKTAMFTIEERLEIIAELYRGNQHVSVATGSGAAVDIAMLHGCKALIRGVRSLTDFDSEIQMANINKDISNNQVNTILLLADPDYQFISSSMVKELFYLGKDINKYVDPIVQQAILKKRR